MKIFHEFKEFAVKGNVIDLAIGVVIGGAFGRIVTALVNDILTPPIGFFTAGVNFNNLALLLRPAQTDPGGKVLSPAVTINLGDFLQTIFDFLIVAVAMFALAKLINEVNKARAVPPPAPPPTPEASEEITILREIRDTLKNMVK